MERQHHPQREHSTSPQKEDHAAPPTREREGNTTQKAERERESSNIKRQDWNNCRANDVVKVLNVHDFLVLKFFVVSNKGSEVFCQSLECLQHSNRVFLHILKRLFFQMLVIISMFSKNKKKVLKIFRPQKLKTFSELFNV